MSEHTNSEGQTLPPHDEETCATALATVVANQDHFKSTIDTLVSSVKDSRIEGETRGAVLHEKMNHIHIETTGALGEVTGGLGIVRSKLDDHVAEDRVAFRRVWVLILGMGGLIGLITGVAKLLEAH